MSLRNEINERVTREYRRAVKEVKRQNPTCGFIRSQSKMLVAGDANGNRIKDPIYFTGPVRMSDVKVMQAWPGVKNIWAQGEVCAYERIYDDIEEGREQWDELVWEAAEPPIWPPLSVDALVALRTGFTSLADIFDAAPSYRPSCDMRDPDMVIIANAYDARAEMFGDPRRAYRYGGDRYASLLEGLK